MKTRPRPKLTLDQRASRRLKRLENRRLKAMPLFVATGIADQIEPLPSLDAIKHWFDHLEQANLARMKAMRDTARAHAQYYSLLVQGLVSRSQLRLLCTQRRRLPSSPEYAADFWRSTYNHLVSPP